MPALWLSGAEWGFAVEYDGRYAGTMSLRNEGPGRAEVAYGSHPTCAALGAMERALRLLLDWGFAERDLHTVIWWANRGNWASRRLAWRLGFTLEGLVRRVAGPAWRAARRLGRDAPARRPPLAPHHLARRAGDRPRRPAPAALGERDVPRIVEACSDPVTQAWLGGLPAPYVEADARVVARSSVESAARMAPASAGPSSTRPRTRPARSRWPRSRCTTSSWAPRPR